MSRAGGVKPDADLAPAIEWSGAILVNRRGEVLLNLRDGCKEHYPNLWDLVGGTLEAGETAEECMLREILEETGETLSEVSWLADFDVPLGDAGQARLHVFLGLIDRNAAELTLGEGQEHRFFDPAGLDGVDVVPGTRALLKAYSEARLRAESGAGLKVQPVSLRLQRLATEVVGNGGPLSEPAVR